MYDNSESNYPLIENRKEIELVIAFKYDKPTKDNQQRNSADNFRHYENNFNQYLGISAALQALYGQCGEKIFSPEDTRQEETIWNNIVKANKCNAESTFGFPLQIGRELAGDEISSLVKDYILDPLGIEA